MGGLGPHFGGSGAPFWSHFGGLGGSWLPNASWEAIWGAPGNQDGSKLKPKMGPSWSQKGIKIDARIAQFFDAIKNRILMDLGRENGGKLAPKSDPKSVSTSKGRFCKKYGKTHENHCFFEVLGVEVGSQIRSKID